MFEWRYLPWDRVVFVFIVVCLFVKHSHRRHPDRSVTAVPGEYGRPEIVTCWRNEQKISKLTSIDVYDAIYMRPYLLPIRIFNRGVVLLNEMILDESDDQCGLSWITKDRISVEEKRVLVFIRMQ